MPVAGTTHGHYLPAALAAGLSACAPLVVGGAVVGTMMAVDRRTTLWRGARP